MSQLEQGKATLIAVLEDIRDGRRTDISYNQDSYGEDHNGVLDGCLACIALSLEQGVSKTLAERVQLRKLHCSFGGPVHDAYIAHGNVCKAAGRELLAMENYSIFGTVAMWPEDIQGLYMTDRIAAGIEALNRLQPDGSFAPPTPLAELTVNSAEPVREEVMA